ncbi:UDP-4-amino-4,6-dideoxy-N-acetyl-beta-L-altrosamine N-acetyltransferase [bacterium]|nr:UDP-4-amino-4,6-dideoxy-N-acetyl-beta-L-altrosamine N-acetyltransferase [bacterium]
MINLRENFILGDFTVINFVTLTDKEKEMVRSWRNNEKVRKWMYSDQTITHEEHSGFIERLQSDDKNFYWILKDHNGNYIGVIYLNRVDFRNRNAYIGIYSDPDNKIPSAGKMLIDCIKKLAFDKAKLHTLKLEVIENNEQAIRFYSKSGFNIEGKLREFVNKDGKWYNVILMGIIN